MKNAPPSIRKSAFNCPHCQAYAQQRPYSLRATQCPKEGPFLEIDNDHDVRAAIAVGIPDVDGYAEHFRKLIRKKPATLDPQEADAFGALVNHVFITECSHCQAIAIWIHDRLLYPATGSGERPNADLPADIKTDFDEANSILAKSPRGAAALLRLAIEKLCRHLIEKQELKLSDKLDGNIATLVKDGLPQHIQEALDVVRVIGNEAVHPGLMDLKDDVDTATTLFMLVNDIAANRITERKRSAAVYATLPPIKLEHIKKRDAGSK